jgi:hypothetical protein
MGGHNRDTLHYRPLGTFGDHQVARAAVKTRGGICRIAAKIDPLEEIDRAMHIDDPQGELPR